MASKTNLPSLIDIVLEYKLGRTNQVADAFSRKTELAAFKCEAVVNSTLGTNVFDIAFVRKRRNICFVTGQPLGYYSSWPLFALSHHILVWYAAEQCYPGRVFTDYALLGDDIVIADTMVAAKYSELLERLGVSISLSKSLISSTGACVVLPPQVIGRVVDRLRDHFIPRDPITPPDEVFPYPGMRDFQEWSLYQGWMRQYLTYLKWYCSVALAPDVSIDAFIDAPIYIRTWHSPKVDLSTFRFGVMFRVYDWVTELLMEDIRVLPISEDVSNVSILGSGLINREQPYRVRPPTKSKCSSLFLFSFPEEPQSEGEGLVQILQWFCFANLILFQSCPFLSMAMKPGNGIRDCPTRPPRKNTPKGSQTQSQPQSPSKATATNKDSFELVKSPSPVLIWESLIHSFVSHIRKNGMKGKPH
ncbi:hypothetical protein L6164_037851 [Bauhinia variegata]|uniref:Uncharacterized protein n=1 Tax=Bauhinia variegata TaxID=167791 RepID=A0ACB9KLE5_BAUVA|nr:hypothetical protein L6164_037851 [Bauhinia variegata]